MKPPRPGGSRPAVGLARALSKLGFCSRSQAHGVVAEGRVRVNGRVRRDPDFRMDPERDRIEVDGARVAAEAPVYLMLNKPRGLVTTASDERGRATVYDCLADPALPRVSPVGRLDRASEGLLLFTNDTRWAARVLDPATHLDKSYHVQVDRLPDDDLLRRMTEGVTAGGDFLAAKR
ncbi:MAG TPA: pseudouridine synthase, partial [Longimicrobiaceae bacterium]